jgi:hypothetical protein
MSGKTRDRMTDEERKASGRRHRQLDEARNERDLALAAIADEAARKREMVWVRFRKRRKELRPS